MRLRSRSKSSSRTSTPSTRTLPPVASKSRGISDSSVVLPAPVLPMIAVVCPASARKLMSRSTGDLGTRVLEPHVAQLQLPVAA